MARVLRISALVAALLWARGVVHAHEGAPLAIDAALARLGPTPAPDAVRVLVLSHEVLDSRDAALRTVAGLRCAGYASALGLGLLSHHNDAKVRASALRALAANGTRLSENRAFVQRASEDAEPDVACAAFEAIGRVGDARDLPALQTSIRTADGGVSEAAGRALGALAGESLPVRATVLELWLVQQQKLLPRRIDAAISRIGAGGSSSEVTEARQRLCAAAWFDIEKVLSAASEWLRSTDARLRAEGFLIAKEARLGDLAEKVGGAFRRETDADVAPLARESAAALGIVTSRRKTPGEAAARADISESGSDIRAAKDPVGAAQGGEPAPDSGASRPASPALLDPATRSAVEARLREAVDLLAVRRYSAARALLDTVRDIGDEQSRMVATKGLASIYWLQRIDKATTAEARNLREEARRSFRSTPWERLF